MTEAPAIEAILIERPDQPFWGAGEAATVPSPPRWATRSSMRTASGCGACRYAARVKEALARNRGGAVPA